MTPIRTKRYFRYQPVDVNGLWAVVEILAGFDSWTYTLRYPAEDIEVNRFADVKSIVATKGPTRRAKVNAKSSGGRRACFDATDSRFISVEYYSQEINPDNQIEKIRNVLSLRPLQRLIDTAFVAHGFDDTGKKYAGEVRLFLETLNISVETGEYFEPGSIPNKVKARIENCDMFVAVVTPQDDHTWITQEPLFADAKGKQPLILVDREVDYKPGMLGDNEYIPFTAGCISEAFVKMLQGINNLRGAV